MRRRVIFPFLCVAALTLSAVPGVARVGVVGVAPPAPVVEVVPAPPAPGYVWQPGYWSWNGVQYVWVPGAYFVAPTETRRGSQEPGSGMAPAGCGSPALGDTGAELDEPRLGSDELVKGAGATWGRTRGGARSEPSQVRTLYIDKKRLWLRLYQSSV
jgi:WXXGXW repeat (2 copies)